MKIYLVDIGTIIMPEEYEFEQYATIYNKKYGYYDENQYYVTSLYKAMKEVMDYLNAHGKYGVVTEQELPDSVLEDENVNSVEEVPVQDCDYSVEAIVFSAANRNGKINQNFVVNPTALSHYYIDKKELHELVAKGYKQGLVNIGIAPDDSGCSGICCNIADSWFYFGDLNTEKYEDNLPQYFANVPEETIIDQITEAIWGIYEDIDNYEEQEAWCYYLYLKGHVTN